MDFITTILSDISTLSTYNNSEGLNIINFPETNIVKYEYYIRNRLLNNNTPEIPAVTCYYNIPQDENREIRINYKVYIVNNVIERIGDNPSIIKYFNLANNIPSIKLYVYNNIIDRNHTLGPAMLYYFQNGNLHVCKYITRGEPHRPSYIGPAVVEYNETGNIIVENYIEYNTYHRDELSGPAIIENSLNTVSMSRDIYIYNGLFHRTFNSSVSNEYPAITFYILDTNGTKRKVREEYYYNNVLGGINPQDISDEKPSVIDYFSDNQQLSMFYDFKNEEKLIPDYDILDLVNVVYKKIYYVNGQIGRRPTQSDIYTSLSEIIYYPNNNVFCEKYYTNNKLHNIDYPAILYFNNDQECISVEFYHNGNIINDENVSYYLPNYKPSYLTNSGFNITFVD